jgi:methylenetetrahydrofolate reductase (NADPH)
MTTQQPNISFEFFPPKTPEGFENLGRSSQLLEQAAPEYFSVTYGAGGSTRTGTADTVTLLRQKTSIQVAPHLACVGSSIEAVLDILSEYKSMGVKRIVALRGDLPSGMGQSGELRYASDLVSLIRKATNNHFHIEVAVYPEVHPQAQNAFSDILNFKRKIDAGANSAITQYFFNPDAYFYFQDYCAKLNIFAPIVPGIMPISHFSKLVRFSEMCGAEIPRWMRKRLEGYGDDQQAIQAFGLEVIYDLCQRLLAGGAPGLHFYTLNQVEPSLTLVKMLNIYSGVRTEASLRSTQPT